MGYRWAVPIGTGIGEVHNQWVVPYLGRIISVIRVCGLVYAMYLCEGLCGVCGWHTCSDVCRRQVSL